MRSSKLFVRIHRCLDQAAGCANDGVYHKLTSESLIAYRGEARYGGFSRRELTNDDSRVNNLYMNKAFDNMMMSLCMGLGLLIDSS